MQWPSLYNSNKLYTYNITLLKLFASITFYINKNVYSLKLQYNIEYRWDVFIYLLFFIMDNIMIEFCNNKDPFVFNIDSQNGSFGVDCLVIVKDRIVFLVVYNLVN